MKRKKLVIALALGCATFLAGTAVGHAKTVAWTKHIGNSLDNFAFGVAVSGSNIYVSGTTQGVLEGSNAGAEDVFVRKLDAAGSTVWTRQFGSTGADLGFGIATDAAGNVVVVGLSNGTIDGQPGLGATDAFARKYDANGNELWTGFYGTDEGDEAFGVDVDSAGNIYICGETHGEIGVEELTAGASSAASAPFSLTSFLDSGRVSVADVSVTADAFLIKIDGLTGEEIWHHQFGTEMHDRALDCVTTASGVSYVTGDTAGNLAGTSNGDHDAYLRKVSAAGTAVWTKQFGTAGYDEGLGVALDNQSRVLLSGRVSGALPGKTALGGFDAFVRRYASGGGFGLTKQFGTAGDDGAWDVASDANGNIYLSGLVSGALPNQPYVGAEDLFVRRLNPDGTIKWTVQRGSPAWDVGFAIDVSGVTTYTAGLTDGTLPGGTSFGARDAFALKA